MADQPVSSDNPASPPRATRKRRTSTWFFWLIPVIAAAIGLAIVWHDWANKGPVITISFQSATGLEQNKTQLKFRDIVVGTVTDIRLSENGEFVLVDVQLDADAKGLATEGSEFWVVKPSIGVSGISGLSTLLSGSYLNVDTKNLRGTGPKKLTFKGLESAPPIASDRPGSTFKLRSPTLGSLNPGSPIYFLRIPVGVVTKYQLAEKGSHVDIDVFIDAPYDKFVGGNTRFWNESGIYVNVGADGLTISTESVVTILAGGLGFANFGPNRPLIKDHRFPLYADKVAASSVPVGVAVPIAMSFYQSTKGLEKGAPVSFQGINIGSVDSTELDFNPYKGQFYTKVKATIYPMRLGPIFQTMKAANATPEQVSQSLVMIVNRGLRAELKTASLLTGSLYIALEIKPDAPKVKNVVAKLPFEIPSLQVAGMDQLQNQIASIISKIEKIPFEKLSTDLSASLNELTALTKSLNNSLSPELVNTLKDLQTTLLKADGFLSNSDALPEQIDKSLKEMDRAVRATKALIDELRAQPNSIIFGEPSQSYSRETLGVDP